MNDVLNISAIRPGGQGSRITSSGPMATRVRNHAWAETPLGSIEGWSTTLISTVNLVLSCPVPAAVYWGPKLIFIENDASAVMVGPRTKDALGLPAQVLWETYWAEVEGHFQAVLSSGASFHGQNVPFHYRAQQADEISIKYSLSPIYEDGRVGGIFRLLEETTEAVLAQRELAESNERLRMALKAGGGVGVWDFHIRTGKVYADEIMAGLYGVDPAAAVGGVSHLEFERMLHPDDISIVADSIMKCILTGESYTSEYRVRRGMGRMDGLSPWGAACMTRMDMHNG